MRNLPGPRPAGVLCVGAALVLSLALFFPRETVAAGSSPNDPIPFSLGGASVALSSTGSTPVWLRLSFEAGSTSSHATLETQGSVDTTLQVFASLAEAQRGTPIATDDDSGPGYNASVRVPLGFLPPYLVRVTGNGSFQLRSQPGLVPAERCDWPAGCSLSLAAQGKPEAAEVLQVLRDVRSEVLLPSRRGRDLVALYWRLGRDLIPAFLTNVSFRKRAYDEVTDLLPLARAALAAARGEDAGSFSREHFDRLRGLQEEVAGRVSPDVAEELRATWKDFALADRVGLPLTEALAATGLLSVQNQPQTVLVKLRAEPVSDGEPGRPLLRTGEARIDRRLAEAGATAIRPVHAASPSRQAAGLLRTIAFEVESLEKAKALVADLETDPSIEWVEISATLRAFATGPDPFRKDLWGLDAVRAPQAWSSTTGACTAPVAVVDTGLRTGLADLEGRILHHLGYDFANGDPDPQDGHGHGTHVAGTIAAAVNNSTSIAGVAPGACVFGVKVLSDDGKGSSEDVAAGIVYAADAGARVINLSLGCDCALQQVIEDALAYAAARDVVIVAAAGNDGVDHLGYPASSQWAISVAALNKNLSLASFSNHGPGLDVSAPGVDVVSLFRDGESCMGSGTSMATPHVAGVAALLRSLNPTLNRTQVQTLLQEKAKDLGAPGYDTTFGAGVVDALASVAAAGGGGGVCTATSTALCLSQQRFRVEAFWRRTDGTSGQGQAVRLTPDTGYFWFFDSANIEVFVKLLNACGVNSRFWAFTGGLTNLEVRMRITDTATGQVKEYVNPLGSAYQPIQDTSAFATCGTAATAEGETQPAQTLPARVEAEKARFLAELPVHPDLLAANCTETATSMCLSGGRFRVEATWRLANGESGSGFVSRLTPDTGYFWFFNSANVEAFVKVLNACGVNNRFWLFAGGLTNVQVRMRVTDTATNQVKEYLNPAGVAFRPVQDTSAFATCP